MQQRTEVPLTFFQKARLLLDGLPFLFLLASLIFTLTLLDNITSAPPPTVLLLLLGFVTLYTGWITIQRLRDVVSGIAVVREDRLKRLWHSRGRGATHYYGDFEQLGTLRMRANLYVQSSNGARYRVTYSPASKIVWSLEKFRY